MVWNTALFLALLLCGLASSEVIKTQKCYIPGGRQANCVIHEVRIEPCPEAEENKPCKVKLGSNSTLSFDYTTTWGATNAGSMAYKVGTITDIGFDSMDSNGCRYTTCPIEANKKQTYTFSLEVNNTFATSTHQVKWKLFNEDDYHQQCCFKFALQLSK